MSEEEKKRLTIGRAAILHPDGSLDYIFCPKCKGDDLLSNVLLDDKPAEWTCVTCGEHFNYS